MVYCAVYRIGSFDTDRATKPLYMVYLLDDSIKQDCCNAQCQHHYMNLKSCKMITVHKTA